MSSPFVSLLWSAKEYSMLKSHPKTASVLSATLTRLDLDIPWPSSFLELEPRLFPLFSSLLCFFSFIISCQFTPYILLTLWRLTGSSENHRYKSLWRILLFSSTLVKVTNIRYLLKLDALLKDMLSFWLSKPTLGFTAGTWVSMATKDIYKDVHSSFLQKLEITKCPSTAKWINCNIFTQWNDSQQRKRMNYCYIQHHTWINLKDNDERKKPNTQISIYLPIIYLSIICLSICTHQTDKANVQW